MASRRSITPDFSLLCEDASSVSTRHTITSLTRHPNRRDFSEPRSPRLSFRPEEGVPNRPSHKRPCPNSTTSVPEKRTKGSGRPRSERSSSDSCPSRISFDNAGPDRDEGRIDSSLPETPTYQELSEPEEENTVASDDDTFSLWSQDSVEPLQSPLQIPPAAAVSRWIYAVEEPRRQLARRIIYALHVGVVPCPEKTHARAEQEHNQSCTRHRGLRHTYDVADKEFGPSDAERSYELGIHRVSPDIPGQWLHKERNAFPSHGRLQKLFTGPVGEREEICLHKDPPLPTVTLQYSLKDVDSALAIFSNLNSFRASISLPIIPIHSRLLESSIHLSYRLPLGGRQQIVPLHKIPHILFGTTNSRSHPIYAFFPNMYEPKGSVHLTDKAYGALYDKVIYPGLLQLSEGIGQHLPGSFTIAFQMAKAAQEKSSKEGNTRGKPINFTFHPQKDPEVWNTMRRMLEQADRDGEDDAAPNVYNIRLFRDLFFLYDSKGLKIETQRQRALSTCIENFQADLEKVIPESRSVRNSKRQYVDIASEVTPVSNLAFPQGTILLAKRCCVYNTVHFLLGRDDKHHNEGGDDEDDNDDNDDEDEDEDEDDDENNDESDDRGNNDDGDKGGRKGFQPQRISQATVTEYPIALLRDCVTLTAELKPRHPHTADGLIYVQTYSPFKELLDARGTFPFSHPGIANLGYSEADQQGFHHIQKTASDRKAAQRADALSRSRIKLATEHKKVQDYGWRTELRVTLSLAHLVRAEEESWAAFLADFYRPRALQTAREGTNLVFLPRTPVDVTKITLPSHAFFPHRIDKFKLFMRHNVHKYLVVIDAIRVLYGRHQEGTPAAVAELHALLALTLRHFVSHLPPAQAGILNRQLHSLGEAKPGFGLRETMNQFGFGFFPPDTVD